MRFGGQVGGETVDDMRFNQRVDRVLRWLKGQGGTATRRDTTRALHLRKRDADDVEQTLNDQGRMGWYDEKSDTGRVTRYWSVT